MPKFHGQALHRLIQQPSNEVAGQAVGLRCGCKTTRIGEKWVITAKGPNCYLKGHVLGQEEVK